MKKEVKDLWVKALRSGEFIQCKGYLEHNGKYCTLGVLSALAMLEGQCTFNYGENGEGKFDNKKYYLSYNVMVWAGIAQDLDDNGKPLYLTDIAAGSVKLTYRGKETSIATLNENGKTFDELADLIDKSWQDL